MILFLHHHTARHPDLEWPGLSLSLSPPPFPPPLKHTPCSLLGPRVRLAVVDHDMQSGELQGAACHGCVRWIEMTRDFAAGAQEARQGVSGCGCGGCGLRGSCWHGSGVCACGGARHFACSLGLHGGTGLTRETLHGAGNCIEGPRQNLVNRGWPFVWNRLDKWCCVWARKWGGEAGWRVCWGLPPLSLVAVLCLLWSFGSRNVSRLV